MQRRQDTVEVFSTFIKFEVDRFSGWIRDSKLRHSMKVCLQQLPEQKSQNFWVLYWHKVWQAQPSSNYLATAHLAAYLQEACYWAVKKFSLNVSSHSSLADYFQIAISQLPKILKNFNPQYSSYLKNYAELAFERVIKDLLKVRKEVHICSDWSLLHKLSRKRLLKSLQNMGFNQQTIECYLLAWECYRELYSISSQQTRQLNKPDENTWQAITKLYNSERSSRLSETTPAVNQQTLEKWLLSCAQAARHLLYPKVVSADTPLTEDSNASLLDMMPSNEQTSLLTQAIEREETASFNNYQTQLNQILKNAIASLKPETRELLEIYYSKQLTQTEIAKQLNLKQYQVSRRLSSIKKSLLLNLIKWSQQTLHISPESDVVGAVNLSLEEWLRGHYNVSSEFGVCSSEL